MKGKVRSLIDINNIQEMKAARNNKKITTDGLNQRAGIKQKKVVEAISKALTVECSVNELDLCKKEICFEKQNNLSYFSINYHSTKVLVLSRVYDLIVKTSVPSLCTDRIEGWHDKKITIGALFTGGLKANRVSFKALCDNKMAELLAQRLSKVDLLCKRVLFLEALDLRLEYSQQKKEWEIGLATPKGSVVWNLLPPIMTFTKFTEIDAIKLVELFQLVIAEVYDMEHHFLSCECAKNSC